MLYFLKNLIKFYVKILLKFNAKGMVFTMNIIVTGTAGFIGSKVAEYLLEKDYLVIGIDNLNDYYDVSLKLFRVNRLKKYENFIFYKGDIENKEFLEEIFKKYKIDAVINEAARAGVRASIENPYVYMTTNAIGTLNLLELMVKFDIKKFILASTSSLYAGSKMPFTEDLPVNTPISPYAASKKSAESLSYTYHYLYDIDVTIFRYFTVYGPAGRPDMSIFRFIYKILKGEPIEIYGDGTQKRDFTYIDDIARGTILGLKDLGYEIINLGSDNPYSLKNVISLIEKYTQKKAKIVYKTFHKADMKATWANIEKAKKLLSWEPKVNLEKGIEKTVNWFLENWDFIKNIKI